MHAWIVTCLYGLEQSLTDELHALGYSQTQSLRGAVCVHANVDALYQISLYSRCASKVLLTLFDAQLHSKQIYQRVNQLPWEDWLRRDSALDLSALSAPGGREAVQQLRREITTAIEQRLQATRKQSLSLDNNGLRLVGGWSGQPRTGQLRLSFDLTGEALHWRHPQHCDKRLPASLAAAALHYAQWQPGQTLALTGDDPTILQEAASLCCNQPANSPQRHYAFTQWGLFSRRRWRQLCAALPSPSRTDSALIWVGGQSIDPSITAMWRLDSHADQSGIIFHSTRPSERQAGWRSYTLLPPQDLSAHDNAQPITSGPRGLSLLENHADRPEKLANVPAKATAIDTDALINRLKKNDRHRRRWAKKEGNDCYRIYDADIRHFALAIDRYADELYVAEYAAPDNIERDLAQTRLNAALAVLPELFNIDTDKIHIKYRDRQRGEQQYNKIAQSSERKIIEEFPIKTYVNLRDYLDSGLFLDHRNVRRLIGQEASSKRFLNLFCYTATASLHAIKGGAKSSTSVDLSNTYTQWAESNYQLNGINSRAHKIIRADVITWLKGCSEQFDLIFCDPPSFSNSKSMKDTFDVQRDHVGLIRACMQRLASSGVLIFSNNKRRFKLDLEQLANFNIENITAKTLPQDFQRRPDIHQVYRITHTPDSIAK